METSNYEHTFRLASHQTMTYLKPTKWWMKLIGFTAKCQSRTLEEQIFNDGVSMIDIRLKFTKNESLLLDYGQFGHGIITYDSRPPIFILRNLNQQLRAKNLMIMCRIMLEHKNPTPHQILSFKNFCIDVEFDCDKIIPFGGVNRYNWQEYYYRFSNHFYAHLGMLSEKIDEQVSSVRCLGLFPRLYAWLFNKYIFAQGTNKQYLMTDFVQWQE